MKYLMLALLCCGGLLWAQEAEEEAPEEQPESEKPEETPPAEVQDPQKLLNDLTLSNAAKDVGRITILVKGINDYAKGTKDQEMAETLAKELSDSIKVCKGNWGTLVAIMETLGNLRTKEGTKALKRIAFQKKVDDENEEKMQAAAIVGIAKMADPRLIDKIGDQCKSTSRIVTKAAYEAFVSYAPAKGKDRKKCAEILMKRLEMESPSSGGQGGSKASAEQQERWGELQAPIIASMQAITRENTINDVENWREWWKENKKNSRSKAWQDD